MIASGENVLGRKERLQRQRVKIEYEGVQIPKTLRESVDRRLGLYIVSPIVLGFSIPNKVSYRPRKVLLCVKYSP